MYPTREMLRLSKKKGKKAQRKGRPMKRVTRDLSAHPAKQREKKESAFAKKMGYG